MRNAENLEKSWKNDERWKGIKRNYSAEEVIRLSGSYEIKYSIASLGAKRLFESLKKEEAVRALGALTGNQAIQQVKA